MDSNSGGPTRRPVTATRMGAWALLELAPEGVGQGLGDLVQGVGASTDQRGRRRGRRRGWRGARVARPPPPRRPRRWRARPGTGSRPWPGPRRGPSTRSWTSGATARKMAASKRSAGHGARGGVVQGGTASTKSSRSMARDVLAVHPSKLVHVEEGRSVVDVLEAEGVDHLLDAQDLRCLRDGSTRAAPGSCAWPRGDNPRRDRTRRPPGRGAWTASAALVHQHGQVGEDRHQRVVVGLQPRPHQQALGRRGQEVLSPDDVGDLPCRCRRPRWPGRTAAHRWTSRRRSPRSTRWRTSPHRG